MTQPANDDAPAPFTLTKEALEALKSGNKMEAIKLIRAATQVGLAEAKSIADAIEKEHAAARPLRTKARAPSTPHRARPGLGPGQMPSSGGPGKWLVLVAVAAMAIVAGIYS